MLSNTPESTAAPTRNDEKQRLELQNNHLLRILGNVQVHAPVDFNDTDEEGTVYVLESWTGSGVWLLDLAKTVPQTTTKLIGIDIHSDLFPQPPIPPNLTFKIGSITSLPTNWTNQFSLIHQRCLFGVFLHSEWIKALNEMYRVLLPGKGWIQLFEVDDWVDMGPALRSYNLLLKNLLKMIGKDGFYPNGYKKWEKMIKERGFVDIRISWHDSYVGEWAGRDGVDMKKNLMALIRGFRDVVLEFGGLGVVDGGVEEYEKWKESVEEEVDEGIGEPKCRWVMICARKPEE